MIEIFFGTLLVLLIIGLWIIIFGTGLVIVYRAWRDLFRSIFRRRNSDTPESRRSDDI